MLKNILLTTIKNKVAKMCDLKTDELFLVEFAADKRSNKLELTINNGQPLLYNLEDYSEFSDMLESQLKSKVKWQELYKLIFQINFEQKTTTATLFCLLDNEKVKIEVPSVF